MEMSLPDLGKAPAWRFIMLVGIISLFSNLAYEGAHRISDPFLETLWADAILVGSWSPALRNFPSKTV
jgi:hypothetical protein